MIKLFKLLAKVARRNNDRKLATSFEKTSELFIQDVKKRGLMETTAIGYRSRLKIFQKYLDENNLSAFTVKRRDIINFIDSMLKKQWSKNTINGVLKLINVFYNWMIFEGLMDYSPMDFIGLLRNPRNKINVLCPADISNLISSCSNKTYSGLRNKAIIILLWDTGLRRSECANALLNNLDLIQRKLNVEGKGGKMAYVYLSPQTAKVLSTWIKARGKISSPYIFISKKGSKLTPGSISEIIRKTGTKAGIKANTHLIRRSVITYLAAEGMKSLSIQAFARHESFRTTAKYIARSKLIRLLRSEHDKFRPGDAINIEFKNKVDS